MARNIEEKIVFGVAPTDDGKPHVILLGMTEGSWEYMAGGLTHTFDLTKIGLPLRIMIFRGRDHSAVMNTIESSLKEAGVPFFDQRNKDFSL